MLALARSNFRHLFLNYHAVILRNNKNNLHLIRKLFARNGCKGINTPIRKKSIFAIFSKESIGKIKESDNVPDAYQLIYRNRMSKYLLAAQVFSTAFAGIVCIGLIVSYDNNQGIDYKEGKWVQKPWMSEQELVLFLSLFIALCVSLQVLVARMPLRVYNYPKQNEYIMIRYGALPTTTKRITCSVNEITKLEQGGILPWRENTYEIRNKGKVILIDSCFRTPADLNIMLGYQKHPEQD